jgi:nicotinic acid phosphoribosyltransferase
VTHFNPSSSLLLTDLYQLTMLQGYLRGGMHDTTVNLFSPSSDSATGISRHA